MLNLCMCLYVFIYMGAVTIVLSTPWTELIIRPVDRSYGHTVEMF